MSRLRREVLYLPGPGGTGQAPRGTRAVVVGGGIAGIAAATVLCERGAQVTLLERDPQLGGRAAGYAETLKTGERIEMERGFHGFFRQYYNLRALLRRVDPELAQLKPLDDYPVLGPGGAVQSFRNLDQLPALRVLKLAWQTPYLGLADLPRIDKRLALEMLAYDGRRTYAEYDAQSARAYLDALGFPARARRMLLDVFSHSFFNPTSEMSAAELLMMFHFYFTANPEGLIFDVARRPMSTAFWEPFEGWLQARGADVWVGTPVQAVRRTDRGGFCVEHAAGVSETDLLVLALDVAGLKDLLAASPELDDAELQSRVAQLELARPFAVLRLWLDRPLAPARPAFAGTTGVGRLDNISLYDRFQDQSAAWAAMYGGSVVELHAYAITQDLDPRALHADLIAGLNAFYPESRSARIVDERMLVRKDCVALPPGGHAHRPTPATRVPNLALAGDFTRMPFPCALMERAAASGMLAANTLLARFGVAPEPLRGVPSRGLLAPIRVRGPRASWSPSHAR